MTAPVLAPTAAREWSAWSTTARVVVTEPGALDRAVQITRRLMAAVDLASSRFRPDSEITRRGDELSAGIEVSSVLAALVGEALAAARLTDGAVDPTLGRALEALGYDDDIAEVRACDRAASPVMITGRAGWRQVQLQGRHLRVPGRLRLDLGATSKAATADWCTRAVHAELGCGVLVSLGGDIATAGAGPQGGWQVHVHDLPGDPETQITLWDGYALATSSTQKRAWTQAGRAVHHILDPRTLRPAPVVWKTATIVAPSCVRANAYSTAAIIKGSAAPAWLEARGVAARLVSADGHVRRVGGWPL